MSISKKQLSYLEETLPNYITRSSFPAYVLRYYFTCFQRYIAHFILIFICQFIALGVSSLSLPAVILYTPMGTAFVLLYVLGNRALLPLIVADCIGYHVHGLSSIGIAFYLIADIVPNILGVWLAHRCFSSEDPEINRWSEWCHFFFVTWVFTCLVSALIRMTYWTLTNIPLDFVDTLYCFMSLWFADVNAIVILFGFCIHWLYMVYSRGNPFSSSTRKTFTQENRVLLWMLTVCILCISLMLASMQTAYFILWMLIAMGTAAFLSYECGLLLSTVLLYVMGFLNYAYFTVHKDDFVYPYGIKFYTLLTGLQFMYCISMLWLANFGKNTRG